MQHLVLILALLLPFVLSWIFFGKVRRWAAVIVVVLGVACNFAVSEWMKSRSITDTEYVGNYAARVEYYEPWDEWVEETCTNDNGEEYDCSHSEYHEAQWKMVDDDGHSCSINRGEYNDIVRYINAKPVFKELRRDYYRIDGDMYYAEIPEERLVIPITRTREYGNRILLNQSLYHYGTITDGEKDSLELFDYPPIVHYSPKPYPNPFPKSVRAYQSSTMGIDEEHPFTAQMNILNATCGHRLRTFVFFYRDREREIAKKQIDRLQLGNFNELIIMLGLYGNEIAWCETHSWEDVPVMRTAVKQWFVVHSSMSTLQDFPAWYAQQIKAGLWTLKDAHDFDYIRVSLSLAQIGWLCVAQIVFQILVFLYIAFFIGRLKAVQTKYFLDDEAKNWLKQYAEAYNKKMVRNEMLSRQEWKILNDNKQYEACCERETKRESTARGLMAVIVCGIIPVISCLPYMLLIPMKFSFFSLFVYVPVAICILALPICVGCLVALGRIGKGRNGRRGKGENG
jgi:hypothetical protein